MRRLAVLALVLSGLGTPDFFAQSIVRELHPRRVWVVADDGTGDFLDLPRAVAAASPGDVIRVLPGDYSSFTTGKSLTIVGETAPTVPVIDGPTRIVGLAGSGQVVLRDLFFVNDAMSGSVVEIEGLCGRGMGGGLPGRRDRALCRTRSRRHRGCAEPAGSSAAEPRIRWSSAPARRATRAHRRIRLGRLGGARVRERVRGPACSLLRLLPGEHFPARRHGRICGGWRVSVRFRL